MRWATAMLLLVAACSGGAPPETIPSRQVVAPSVAATVPAPTTEGAAPAPTAIDAARTIVATQPPDGNRWYPGIGSMTVADPFRIDLAAAPLWLGGLDTENGLRLGVVLEDGSVLHCDVSDDGTVEVSAVGPVQDPTAPVSFLFGRELEVVPHVTSSQMGIVQLHDGAMTIGTGDDLVGANLEPLPDGKPVVDRESGYVAVLTDPTDRYGHGVLGDATESASVTIVDGTTGLVSAVVPFPDDLVAEATSAMWVDAGGEPGLLVSLSDQRDGARLRVFDTAGGVLAAGDAIGRGNRWRHQIGAAAIGPTGGYEIVDVLTPHLGGVVEFFHIEEGRLVEQASTEGLTSHGIGSRNLDWMALVDVDGDGSIEVVGPTQDRRSVGAVERIPEGAVLEWTLPLPGRMSTNLMVAGSGDGVWVGVGTDEGVVLLWPPP